MHWLTSLHSARTFFFLKKFKKTQNNNKCMGMHSLTFKSHNFMIIGVCLRFVLIENGKLYFKPHTFKSQFTTLTSTIYHIFISFKLYFYIKRKKKYISTLKENVLIQTICTSI